MTTAFYTILAVLPSIIWLFFYLRKDKHPEPNKLVVKVFFLGFLSAFGALFFQVLYQAGLKSLSLEKVIILFIIGGAFIEEYLKYFAARKTILKDPEFDEPIDAMLYLIISALGFAACENIFLLNGLYVFGTPQKDILTIILIRFFGAVFLHALASAIIGYFFARSLLLKHERKSFLGLGILLATGLHTIYNYIIMEVSSPPEKVIILLVILLGSMAIYVSIAFKKLIKLKSICKI